MTGFRAWLFGSRPKIVYGRRMRDSNARTAAATRAVQRRRRERLVDEIAQDIELLSDQARAQLIQLADRLRVPAGAR